MTDRLRNLQLAEAGLTDDKWKEDTLQALKSRLVDSLFPLSCLFSNFLNLSYDETERHLKL